MLQRLLCILIGHDRWRHVYDDGINYTREPAPYCLRCGKWIGEWWRRP